MGKRKNREEMVEAKREALQLIGVNPTLSMSRVAKHVGVSDCTVAKWFDEANLKRW